MVSVVFASGYAPEKILSAATQLTGIPAKDLEIDDDDTGAIALVIYITMDKNGQRITDSGSVMFSDVDATSIATGDDADSVGIGVFTMPAFGVFVSKATVDYIRKK